MMKRSQINQLMREAIAFFDEQKFYLPPFAYWSAGDWKQKGPEVAEIVNSQLGWDITDFGSGHFESTGLVLFTIRNGRAEEIPKGGKNYAEKIMIVRDGQAVPTHFHFQKVEDIINRGGGQLVVQLYNATEDNQLASTPVTFWTDGVERTMDAGGYVELVPGESITLPTHGFHKFWGKPKMGQVLVGEVSSVNDDHVDNYFLEELARFAAIEEDEGPLYLLAEDYKNVVGF